MSQELIATLMRERDEARADIVRLSDLAISASDAMESACEAMDGELNELRRVVAQQAAEILVLRAQVEQARACFGSTVDAIRSGSANLLF